jgi:hypothetical protein
MPRYIPPLGVKTFLELDDTPDSYSGKAGGIVRVKNTEDGLAFGFPVPFLDWSCRKKITIQGSTGAGTNYQVLLKIGESSGSTGADFHLEGHSAIFPSGKNDGGDLRFTASDGSTLLDFWVEQVTGTSPNRVAYVWVEVSADLGSNQDIYCYFGNPAASNASNGVNTFLFFDDFPGTSLDTNKWTIESGTIPVSNSLVTLQGDSGSIWDKIRSNTQFSPGIALRFYGKIIIGGTYKGVGFGVATSDITNGGTDMIRFFPYSDGTLKATVGTTEYNLGSYSSGVFYTFDITWLSSEVKFFLDGTLKQTVTSGIPSGPNYVKMGARDVIQGIFDWVIVRKYVYPEPAFLSAGPLET